MKFVAYMFLHVVRQVRCEEKLFFIMKASKYYCIGFARLVSVFVSIKSIPFVLNIRTVVFMSGMHTGCKSVDTISE